MQVRLVCRCSDMRLRQDNGVIMSFLAMLGAESWAISTLRDWLGLGSSLEIPF